MTYKAAPPKGALVAVVTPVYNGAKEYRGEAHIETAIRAVQAQTYRPLVHCILDNASSDATPDIIARYAAAKSDIPIITARNPETIPFQKNWNAALRLMPKDTFYFRMLHADDTMPPHAIEAMMDVARSEDDIVMVAGGERLNGRDRPHFFPPECSVYEASNMQARTLSDEAHVPSAHVLYRSDLLKEGEEFYSSEFVECGIHAVFRVLSGGGRAGFVHRHIADTIRYAASGSLIQTLAKDVKAVIWEKLLFIEQYGPAALSNAEYARVRGRFLRVYFRRLLWWAVSGRGHIVKRDLANLRERGIRPSLWDYFASVAVYPAYLFAKRVSKPHAALPWPADAVKLGDRREAIESSKRRLAG
jgi:glycosyltransferase involved in cell wall biosynthesis